MEARSTVQMAIQTSLPTTSNKVRICPRKARLLEDIQGPHRHAQDRSSVRMVRNHHRRRI